MTLLDTNVLSELTRRMPDPAVERWLVAQLVSDLFVSAITEAELRYGVAVLPPGKRRSLLAAATEDMLANDLRGRILPFDSPAAVAYADIVAPPPGRPAHLAIRRADCRHRTLARCRARNPQRAGLRRMRHNGDQPMNNSRT